MLDDKSLEKQVQHLTAYLSAAYRVITSLERRVAANENELVQLQVKYIGATKKRHEPVRAIPDGYEIIEENGFYFWRRLHEPRARAPFGEPTSAMARVRAAYHYLETEHVLRARIEAE